MSTWPEIRKNIEIATRCVLVLLESFCYVCDTHPFRVLPEKILYVGNFLRVILHHINWGPSLNYMAKSTFIIIVNRQHVQ